MYFLLANFVAVSHVHLFTSISISLVSQKFILEPFSHSFGRADVRIWCRFAKPETTQHSHSLDQHLSSALTKLVSSCRFIRTQLGDEIVKPQTRQNSLPMKRYCYPPRNQATTSRGLSSPNSVPSELQPAAWRKYLKLPPRQFPTWPPARVKAARPVSTPCMEYLRETLSLSCVRFRLGEDEVAMCYVGCGKTERHEAWLSSFQTIVISYGRRTMTIPRDHHLPMT